MSFSEWDICGYPCYNFYHYEIFRAKVRWPCPIILLFVQKVCIQLCIHYVNFGSFICFYLLSLLCHHRRQEKIQVLWRDVFAIPADQYFVGMCLGDTIFYSGNIGSTQYMRGSRKFCQRGSNFDKFFF